MGRIPTAALVVLGLALTLGTPALVSATRPAPSVGEVPATSPSPSPAPAPAPEAAAPTRSPEPAWTVDARDASITSGASAPVEAVHPVGLLIPAIGVDAAVVDVGVEPDGEMEVPADVSTAGWYRFGPVPGDAGSAVVAGHVDSRTQGLGAFHRLRELGTDQRVDVVLSDGTVRSFVTVARETYDKTAIPLEDVFSREGPSRLALITCGGDFDRRTGHYVSNVVVYAVPA